MVAQASLFVLGVFTHEHRYLIVRERDGTSYLPAGKVEPGENLVAAIVRETIEEANQLVGIFGLLGVDHDIVPSGERGRLRFVFAGYRGVLIPPKNKPDEHSLGAEWLTRDEVSKRRLRHPEVLHWIDRHAQGAIILPTRAYECKDHVMPV